MSHALSNENVLSDDGFQVKGIGIPLRFKIQYHRKTIE